MERDGHRKLHLTADVTKAVAEEDPKRRAGIKEYEDHKENFAKNIQFDGKRANKSKLFKILNAGAFNIFFCRKSHSLQQPVLSYLSWQRYL